MGIFDWLFKKAPKPSGGYQGEYKLLTGYSPNFTPWGGDAYESEIVRAAIGIRATHVSKLRVETQGSARRALQAKLKHGPNQFQTWSQFLYRLMGRIRRTQRDLYSAAEPRSDRPIWRRPVSALRILMG